MLGIVLTLLIFTQNGQNISKPPDQPVAEAVAREGRMSVERRGGEGGGGGRRLDQTRESADSDWGIRTESANWD